MFDNRLVIDFMENVKLYDFEYLFSVLTTGFFFFFIHYRTKDKQEKHTLYLIRARKQSSLGCRPSVLSGLSLIWLWLTSCSRKCLIVCLTWKHCVAFLISELRARSLTCRYYWESDVSGWCFYSDCFFCVSFVLSFSLPLLSLQLSWWF